MCRLGVPCSAGDGGRLRPVAVLVSPFATPQQLEHKWVLGLGTSDPTLHFGATAKALVLVQEVLGPVCSCSLANSPPACENEVRGAEMTLLIAFTR